ncbi:putative pla2g4b [Xylona heveae TC161]|uniref:Putative pla2g4b n=1 Tax=Xylona heveae (strain CBS 132557 / TC161) TaxID=1328760 RepID=A0A165JT59_XYLHT|nr:putative pla2g4b [Xylona heveae TC161]KZF26590.1 putative pla2g4b [Xylona heveae TC161]
MESDSTAPALSDALAELIENYHELNASTIDELHNEPSPLEFMHYVALNRPFVVRGATSRWTATRKWNAAYLREIMRGQMVNVAITPLGNADSPVQITSGDREDTLFVKPLEVQEAFEDVLEYISKQELEQRDGEIKYAQTQNDNLRGEYTPLASDVQDIPWVRIALEKDPEAINFWLGNSRSVTALHKDNFENIYCQVIGQKHFVLMPPIEMPCVREKELPGATYAQNPESGKLEIKLDEESNTVPFPTWDPDVPERSTTAFSKLSRPLRVTLNAGDMLYLPAMWYHKVSQSCSDEGLCCAVNYWYDMEFAGSFHSLCAFERSAALQIS